MSSVVTKVLVIQQTFLHSSVFFFFNRIMIFIFVYIVLVWKGVLQNPEVL